MHSQVPKLLYAGWAVVLLAGMTLTGFWIRDVLYFYVWVGIWVCVAFAYETWTFWCWWRGGGR